MRPIEEGELDEVLKTESYREKREHYVQRMKDEGFEIYVPAENELFIDIDSSEQYDRFNTAAARLSTELEGDIKVSVKPSKSGLPKRHAIVTLPFEVEHEMRIALQAVMGSDPVREMLSIFRLWQGDPCPTLFADKAKKRR